MTVDEMHIVRAHVAEIKAAMRWQYSADTQAEIDEAVDAVRDAESRLDLWMAGSLARVEAPILEHIGSDSGVSAQ